MLTSVLKPSELPAHEMVEAVPAFDSLEIVASLKAVVFESSSSSKLMEETKAVALADSSRMAGGDGKINSLGDPLRVGVRASTFARLQGGGGVQEKSASL